MLITIHVAHSSQHVIEASFYAFAIALSVVMGVPLSCHGCVKYGVGGMLPNPNHAIIGISDFRYQAGSTVKFCTEMKTCAAYPPHEPWYRKSRACQGIGALYYSGVPLLLCSPAAFKLLIEPESRDSIYLFPQGHYSGDPTDSEFPIIVGLLLLSTRLFSSGAAGSKAPATPVRNRTISTAKTTAEKLKRPELRRSNRNIGAKLPAVYDDPSASENENVKDAAEGRRIFFSHRRRIRKSISEDSRHPYACTFCE